MASIRVTGFGALNWFQWFDDREIGYSIAMCAADLSGDGQVDGDYLGVLLGAWGNSPAGDINGDGATDGADLAALMAEWGAWRAARPAPATATVVRQVGDVHAVNGGQPEAPLRAGQRRRGCDRPDHQRDPAGRSHGRGRLPSCEIQEIRPGKCQIATPAGKS